MHRGCDLVARGPGNLGRGCGLHAQRSETLSQSVAQGADLYPVRAPRVADTSGPTEIHGLLQAARALGTSRGAVPAGAARGQAPPWPPSRRTEACECPNRSSGTVRSLAVGNGSGNATIGEGSPGRKALERVCRSLPSPGLQEAFRLLGTLFHRIGRTSVGLYCAQRGGQSTYGS